MKGLSYEFMPSGSHERAVITDNEGWFAVRVAEMDGETETVPVQIQVQVQQEDYYDTE